MFLKKSNVVGADSAIVCILMKEKYFLELVKILSVPVRVRNGLLLNRARSEQIP